MRFGPSGGETVLGNFAGEVGDIVQAMPCDMCQVGEVEIGGIMCYVILHASTIVAM